MIESARKLRPRLATAQSFAFLVAFAVLLLCAGTASAHDVPYTYLDLTLANGSAQIALTAHVVDLGHDLNIFPLAPLLDPSYVAPHAKTLTGLLQPRMQIEADHRPVECGASDVVDIFPAQETLRMHFSCPVGSPAVLTLHVLMFPYDPTHQTFVNVYEGSALISQATLNKDHTTFDYFSNTRQGVLAVIRKFVPGGIRSILFGPDHLFFVFGLLLLGGSARRFLAIATMFAVGLSVTLSLTAMNLLRVPPKLVGPAIALSVVYVGVDNLISGNARDVRHWMAFAFGLLHGFGFGYVLAGMDLPQRLLGWSLSSFILGVGIGLAGVVFVMASVLAALRSMMARIGPAGGKCVVIAGSILVIVAGAFSFVERAFFRP